MSHLTPLVLERVSLDGAVQYVLKQDSGPSAVIFCGTKGDLIEQLTPRTTENRPANKATNDHEADVPLSTTEPAQTQQWWAVPTLQLLANSRYKKVVFCPDITHLRAYLATYRLDPVHHPLGSTSNGSLAILNPVNLHRQTSAFSAQGLNRTLSAAVEAAHRAGSRLVIAECTQPLPPIPDADVGTERPHDEGDFADRNEPALTGGPWEEEVSILNVTTKSFGVGERGWVGRTVKLRAIVSRWCTFDDLSKPVG
ncbi:hypothetical protein LTR78_002125 [Recurvomyces mirabilis]|uniref:Uncharacterized protein n=1 Tax=Recurvomyces mirabilis TaxID=574656 RepID=A0AAE0WUH9_9PEZI|nr:hypothetical protein LTR78_002125 [Recurvomyces mirabilis]KAK5160582.1 hypothetical protein LTS14_001594 [Recurvomyces mirabilis]